ncbi:MAG: universal stress protein [Burkholderiales bacterium]
MQTACREAGVLCETVCETSDHPYDAIIKTANAKNCDLILLHSHGRKGLAAVCSAAKRARCLPMTKKSHYGRALTQRANIGLAEARRCMDADIYNIDLYMFI